MRPIWRRIGSEIVILAEQEYRFNWRDADVASALYQSLLAEHSKGELTPMTTATSTAREFIGKQVRSYHADGSLLATMTITSIEVLKPEDGWREGSLKAWLDDGTNIVGDADYLTRCTKDAERADVRATWAEQQPATKPRK